MHSPNKAACWLALEPQGRLALYKGSPPPNHGFESRKALDSTATLLWELFPGSPACGERCCLTLTFEGQLEVWSAEVPGSGELLFQANHALKGAPSAVPDPSSPPRRKAERRDVLHRIIPEPEVPASLSLFELVLTRERLCGEYKKEAGLVWLMAPRGLVLQNALTQEVLWSSCPHYDRESTLCRVDRLYRARELQGCASDLRHFWERNPTTSQAWEYPSSMWEQAYCTLCLQTLCATLAAAADSLPSLQIPHSPPLNRICTKIRDPSMMQLSQEAQRKAANPREAALAKEAALLTEPRHTTSDAESFYATLHRSDAALPPRELSPGGYVTPPNRIITLYVIDIEGDAEALAVELETALYWLIEAVRLLARWEFRIVAAEELERAQLEKLATATSAEACWANATAWIASGNDDVMTTWWLVAPGNGVTGSGVGRTFRGAPILILPAARVNNRPGQLDVSSQLAGRTALLESAERMIHADRFVSQQIVRFAYSGVDRKAPRCSDTLLRDWLVSLCPSLEGEELPLQGQSPVVGAQDEVRETEQFLHLLASGWMNHLGDQDRHAP